jgi:hypothetical protein
MPCRPWNPIFYTENDAITTPGAVLLIEAGWGKVYNSSG